MFQNKKKRFLPDVVTVWRSDGTQDEYGNPQFEGPYHYYVRHERASRLYRVSDGREVRSRSVLWVDADIGNEGDYVAFIESNSLSPIGGSFEIQDKRMQTSLSGKDKTYRFLV